MLNPVGDDGGVGVGSEGGGEENDTLALPLALVSQTRVAVLYVFVISPFFPFTFLLSPYFPYYHQ